MDITTRWRSRHPYATKFSGTGQGLCGGRREAIATLPAALSHGWTETIIAHNTNYSACYHSLLLHEAVLTALLEVCSGSATTTTSRPLSCCCCTPSSRAYNRTDRIYKTKQVNERRGYRALKAEFQCERGYVQELIPDLGQLARHIADRCA